MKLAAMEEYIRVVFGLLAEETVEAEVEGRQRKIRFLNPDLGLINTGDAIPLHISAYGPRGRALTARLAAGWLNFLIDVPVAIRALDAMQQAWGEAGREVGDLSATVFAVGCVLADGEPYDSERAMAQAGPRAAVALHRAADEALAGLPNASGIPAAAAEAIQGYVDLARTFEPADAPYLTNHRGHLMFLKPEERPFVTAELIRDTTFTATEAELEQRIGDLRDAGYTQLTIQIVPGQEDAIDGWARIFQAFA
jgi:5,10-methylenetetrahydromethanopterin reductase